IGDLIFCSQGTDLCLGEVRATRLHQIAERDQVRAVAARADFPEHLEAALELVLVIGAEDTGERPALLFDRSACLGGIDLHRGQTGYQSHGSKDELLLEHNTRPDHAFAFLPRTLSEMLVGSGLGVSIRDSTGSTTRK